MNLPPELVALLRSEAYATLCRRSLVAALERQNVPVLTAGTAPGLPTLRNSREPFQVTLRVPADTEAGLRRRLALLAPVEAWLEPAIPPALHRFLVTTSADYRYYNGICEAVKLWEFQMNALREKGLALARAARAVADAIGRAPAARGPRLSRSEAMIVLRAVITATSRDLADLGLTSRRITQLSADELPATAQLPATPQFRTLAWLERLSTLPPAAAVTELETCEAEARTFVDEGITTLLDQSAATHVACLQLREDYLHACWQEAREHALSHYVHERDLEEVLAELQAHQAADRQQRERDPAGDSP